MHRYNGYGYRLLFFLLFFSSTLAAQPPAADTLRLVQILKGQSLREKRVDSVNIYQTIAGNVLLKEGNTIFSCDSAVINRSTNIVEAYGNIHINQQDSIHTYAQYLRYIGNERMAYLRRDVRLTDKKGTLTTQELEYDLKTSIGKYTNGGKVVNGKTILNSREGVYYADTKDVFFKSGVHLTDPKYDITSDSLQYNTQTQLATFITATYIKSKDGGDIFTTSGTYDLKKGKAFFGSRSIFKDSTRTYVADNSAYDEESGIAQLEGNAIIKDSVNGYSVLGNQIFLDKKKNTFLATRKPILIFKGDGNDSTFIAADTLFSGVQITDHINHSTTTQTDTLQQTTVINGNTIPPTIKGRRPGPPNRKPTTKPAIPGDETKPLPPPPTIKNDIEPADTNNIAIIAPPVLKDTIQQLTTGTDSSTATIANKVPDSAIVKNKTDTIRYFIAFHHVRIFNDSLQSVCDSMYYSSSDSMFRLYRDPLVFANKSQVSGDTIHLYTKNKKADRIYAFYNGIIINKLNEEMYNQIAGRTLDGYFKDGNIDYMRAKGQPAESIFYPQDDDSAFTGMNRSSGEAIDVYFRDKEVHRVKFINDVNGTFYPINQIPADQKNLQGFKWLDARRPKNKLELFE